MSEDITTRLRRDCMSLIADEAADTIEQLRADVMCLKYQNAEFVRNLTMAQDERNAATAERDEARQQVARLLDVETGNRIAIANMTAERDALRLELWNLQRGFCNVASSRNKEITGSPRRPMQIARDNGWKCFEDEAYGPLED
jgi:hypothetical protein